MIYLFFSVTLCLCGEFAFTISEMPETKPFRLTQSVKAAG
jgi:hypothetical protein